MRVFYTFNNEQKRELFSCLETIQGNPYTNYRTFRDSSTQLIREARIPEIFCHICEAIVSERKEKEIYTHLLRNCSIDSNLPVFDQDDPVNDKYKTKKTYIGEALLEVFSQLTNIPLLAYQTRNNGDFFHDVYASNKYSNTQTQKTDGELYFHNDRTAHPVRSDYLMLLGMRCFEEDRIYTGYLDGRELLNHLSAEVQQILRKRYFITPFDDYSRTSNKNQVISDKHVILENHHSFRYYDVRTTYAEDAPVEAKDAIIALKNAIIKGKKERVQIKGGDLLCIPNQDGLHNREIIEVEDLQKARTRWLLKSYNFRDTASLNRFADHYYEELPGLVREIASTQATSVSPST